MNNTGNAAVTKLIELMKNELKNKSNSSHTHDDRYYTESEINSKLNSKSNTNHNHNKIQDAGDGRDLTFNYSASGLNSAEWIAAWNGNQLRAISPSVLKNTMGIPNLNDIFKADSYKGTKGNLGFSTWNLNGNEAYYYIDFKNGTRILFMDVFLNYNISKYTSKMDHPIGGNNIYWKNTLRITFPVSFTTNKRFAQVLLNAPFGNNSNRIYIRGVYETCVEIASSVENGNQYVFADPVINWGTVADEESSAAKIKLIAVGDWK